jgi:hypothetical protein
MGLSFTICAGLYHCSSFRVRVSRDSWPHFPVSDATLPQPGGPGSHIYNLQEQGGPVIPPGTGFPFRRLIRLAGLQWRYSNPPPHGLDFWQSESESESELLHDWRFTANNFVFVTSSLRPTAIIFLTEHCFHSPYVILSDECIGLSYTIAAGPRQHSYSEVRVPRDSWPYFTVWNSRLPQPGGPSTSIYIPQEQCGPVISPGTGFPFQSQSYVTVDGQSAGLE